ncbi:MAG: hypothetical protein JKY08_07285 [Flavobacteriaceae bacterium]|nr:hypothetical protein [Flavobacteriaceae bacterium]
MGIFSFFNKNKSKEVSEPSKSTFKEHLIDDFLIVTLPIDWIPYESDRFRARTTNEKLQMSIINYGNQTGERIVNAAFFKELKLELYERFVTEGEYEPYEDLIVTNNFITKSFKVDDETQYYLTTARNVNGRLIITDIIIRELDDYSTDMSLLIQEISNSMQLKE